MRPDRSARKQPAPGAAAYPVVVHVPQKLTSVAAGGNDVLGRPTRVSCVECHSQRPNEEPRSVEQLDEFHVGLRFAHGDLRCISCHGRPAHEQLRLASGETLHMTEVMQLCAQCHGPQTRDYRRGSHGGMSGYWDLSRGPRSRNNCVDCHDPHAPAYPGFVPAAPPRDRSGSQGTGHE
jgi:hypothetical protein